MNDAFSAPDAPVERNAGAAADFGRFGDRDVSDLIAEYPLALVSVPGRPDGEASLLPLIAECDPAGKVGRLIGHLSRRNPLATALDAEGRAAIVFRGPEAYISPDLAGRSDWAPTWNYCMVRIEGDIRLAPELTEMSLQILVEAMEREREQPWSTEELGPRYPAMKQEIIGFTVDVTRVSGRFKLAQDEPPEILNSILAGLADPAMVRWMRRFNRERA